MDTYLGIAPKNLPRALKTGTVSAVLVFDGLRIH